MSHTKSRWNRGATAVVGTTEEQVASERSERVTRNISNSKRSWIIIVSLLSSKFVATDRWGMRIIIYKTENTSVKQTDTCSWGKRKFCNKNFLTGPTVISNVPWRGYPSHHDRYITAKSICYFDNCNCHQNCNCWLEIVPCGSQLCQYSGTSHNGPSHERTTSL